MTWAAILVLAGGTYAMRLVGPLSHQRVRMSRRVEEQLSRAAVLLLVALVATSSLTAGHEFAGWARPAGVLVAVALVVRRAPFPVIVVAAAGTTAVLRLLGVS
jgi:branched-subunit amino acid transport protein